MAYRSLVFIVTARYSLIAAAGTLYPMGYQCQIILVYPLTRPVIHGRLWAAYRWGV